jgi:hypothetical protein
MNGDFRSEISTITWLTWITRHVLRFLPERWEWANPESNARNFPETEDRSNAHRSWLEARCELVSEIHYAQAHKNSIRKGLGVKPPFAGKTRGARNTCSPENKWCGRVDSNHHGIATASPSSWCVCQFRHDRTEENQQVTRVRWCPFRVWRRFGAR